MAEPLPEPLSYAPKPARRVPGFAIASLTLGILAIPMDYLLCTGSILGLLAIIFGAVSLRRIRSDGTLRGAPIALVGIILGSISILLAITCGLWISGAFGQL